MPVARFTVNLPARVLAVTLSIGVLGAQTCLVLSSGSTRANGAASLDLALFTVGGPRPSAVQWSFKYPSESTRKLIVEDGVALTTAGKTTLCAGDATTLKCITVGKAEKLIEDGIIARVSAALAPGANPGAISIKDALGTSPTANVIEISAKVKPAGSGTGSPADCTQPKPQEQPRK